MHNQQKGSDQNIAVQPVAACVHLRDTWLRVCMLVVTFCVAVRCCRAFLHRSVLITSHFCFCDLVVCNERAVLKGHSSPANSHWQCWLVMPISGGSRTSIEQVQQAATSKGWHDASTAPP